MDALRIKLTGEFQSETNLRDMLSPNVTDFI